MIIEKVKIENYKIFKKRIIEFKEEKNIIIGSNETGKSTLLEAINLCMTCKLNGRNINYELSPFLFNKTLVLEFFKKIKEKNEREKVKPPYCMIEVYFQEDKNLAFFKGTNNSLKESCYGIQLKIELDDSYSEEFNEYIRKEEVNTIPVEYYKVNWFPFSQSEILNSRKIPCKMSLIDTSTVNLYGGKDYYITQTIDNVLDESEKAELSILYRLLREKFAKEDNLKKINEDLKLDNDYFKDKELKLSVDISSKKNWQTNLTSYLDDIPFQNIGKGEQSILKMLLALKRKDAQSSSIILIEEPENHLAFSSLNILMRLIDEQCENRQLFIVTHSSYVLNKLGIDNLILLSHDSNTKLNQLTPETTNYFKKLSSYDSLRFILSEKVILVEGPSDDLILQKAYMKEHNKLPIEDGIDIISLSGLSFKRYLELAKPLKKEVKLITDNDGNIRKLKETYADYEKDKHFNIFYCKDESQKTLEDTIVNVNGLDTLNQIFNKGYDNKEKLIKFMKNNKTECAMMILESDAEIIIPNYIREAIEQ